MNKEELFDRVINNMTTKEKMMKEPKEESNSEMTNVNIPLVDGNTAVLDGNQINWNVMVQHISDMTDNAAIMRMYFNHYLMHVEEDSVTDAEVDEYLNKTVKFLADMGIRPGYLDSDNIPTDTKLMAALTDALSVIHTIRLHTELFNAVQLLTNIDDQSIPEFSNGPDFDLTDKERGFMLEYYTNGSVDGYTEEEIEAELARTQKKMDINIQDLVEQGVDEIYSEETTSEEDN